MLKETDPLNIMISKEGFEQPIQDDFYDEVISSKVPLKIVDHVTI